ncbi:HNH endonuclease signature motif containing protein [Labrys sp. La1]|uniref:HNH endonuclease signature motif containing protein n=1 Tax=Labrys sp. La1 TaxID=3404917 RepID=UPI003EB744FF
MEYERIQIDGKAYRAHRLAWLYMHGEWPAEEVDHINGDKFDNRIANLRACSKSQNQANCGTGRNNTSGFKGVSWHKGRGMWVARIQVEGRPRSLGYHADKKVAAAAYDRAAKELFGAFARTNEIMAA